MITVLRLVGVGVAIAVLALAVRSAEAKKLPSWVIAGGELGPYAAHIVAPIPEEHAQPIQLPGLDAQAAAPPSQLPDLSYDLYSFGSFPIGLTNGGPEHRYYPELKLLQRGQSDSWARLAPEAVAFLDAAIEEALAKSARGELEQGPIAAAFRARRLPEVRYWLRPSGAVDESPVVPALASCAECIGLAGPSEAFIMRDLLAVVSQAPRAHDRLSEPPAFLIEYEGIVEPPYGVIGGRLGYYDPPAGDAPGRFWPGGYSPDTPYYETTAGFDAVIAEALSRTGVSAQMGPAAEPVKPRSASADNGWAISMTTAAGAGLAVVGVALGGGAGALYARRRRGARDS